MQSLVEYFLSGGPLMWPILFCSVLSWAIIIERAVCLRRGRIIDGRRVAELEKALEAGDLALAENLGNEDKRLAGRVVGKAIHSFRHAAPDLRVAIEDVASRELTGLWNHLITLNTTGRVGVLLGLLGTVVGMVRGFQNLTAVGVETAQVASAISVALTTTVGGLCVAIPAIVGEAAIRGRIRRLLAEFESIFDRILNAATVGRVTKPILSVALPADAEAQRTPDGPEKATQE